MLEFEMPGGPYLGLTKVGGASDRRIGKLPQQFGEA